jgi:predicted NUDIX family phosphoesterase/dephospho-CoA kinase
MTPPDEQRENENATYLWVAETVLRKHGRPLKAREIVSFGIEDGLFADRELSKTPQKSMQARLSIDILDKGADSKFLRTGRGLFFLRENLTAEKNSVPQEYTAIRRIPSPPSENVLTISRAGYKDVLDFQGIDVLHADRLKKLLASPHLTYMPRTQAETVSDHKQFVTYTIIQNKTQILSFRRGQYNRAAAFLRGAHCVGFGGHVTENDLDMFTYHDHGIRANAAREISEEIRFKDSRPTIDPANIELLGILNDDSSDVGLRHLAIVLRYWTPESAGWDRPLRGEASVSQLRWIDLRRPKLNLTDFEYWSQLCLRKFYAPAVTARPIYRIVHRKPFQHDHILCVIGTIGSGKSIAAQCFQNEAGYTEVNSGRILARIMGIPPVPETPRSQFQDAAQGFISTELGPTVLAYAIIEEAKRIGASKIIVDGIRHPATLKALREHARRSVAVVYIHTPPDVAYELYTSRETPTERISPAEFASIQNAPVESMIRYLIDDADAIVYNWFGVEEYRFVLRQLIEELQLALHDYQRRRIR